MVNVKIAFYSTECLEARHVLWSLNVSQCGVGVGVSINHSDCCSAGWPCPAAVLGRATRPVK